MTILFEPSENQKSIIRDSIGAKSLSRKWLRLEFFCDSQFIVQILRSTLLQIQDQIFDLKAANAKEIQDLKTANAKEIRDLKTEIRDLKTENAKQIRDLKTTNAKEIQDLKTEYAKEIRDLKTTNTKEIRDLKTANSNEVRDLRAIIESRDDEIVSLEEKTATLEREGGESRVRITDLEEEIRKVRNSTWRCDYALHVTLFSDGSQHGPVASQGLTRLRTRQNRDTLQSRKLGCPAK